MNLFHLFSPEWFFATFCLGFSSSKSSQQQSSSSSSTVNDSRVALADQAIQATGGASVDRSVNDNRTFDDHSTFALDGSDNSTNVDSRNFSDNSTFAVDASQTDSSTHTTTITTSDPETLKEMARGAFTAANLITTQGASILEKALGFGDAVSARSIEAQEKAAADTRTFAEGVVTKVMETTKSADQQNTEKIVRGAVILGGAALGTYAAVKIFGKAK